MEEKIKNLYGCNRLNGHDPLVIWYNQVIEKCPGELTVADVARCIRQNLFMNSACEMMLVYLLHNPYEGDVYNGELMDKACELEPRYLRKYKSTILEIIGLAHKLIETYEWECEEDKNEYEESVNKLEELAK